MEFRRAEGDEGRYGWIEQVLRRVEYRRLARADKGAVLAYLQHLSGYSRAQVTRLVSRWMGGKPLVKNYRRPEHAFARRYTVADVALLAEVDRAMGTLSGPATACALRRHRDVFKDARFERLGDCSVGHLYNLRNSAPYRAQRVVLTKTRPTKAVSIGVRKARGLPAAAHAAGRTGAGRVGCVFQPIVDGRARRPLMAFVMVLSYSRAIFLRFFLDARMDSFLRGHVEAFAALGVARVLLYDDLKSAVLERKGDAIRFNPELLTFAGHYRYEPRPVAVARGNEKGRVERAIRYVRYAFFAAREFADLADLNAQARLWCEGQASDRRWPEDSRLSVREAFEAERASLLALPEREFALGERVAVQVGKTPYVRFDLNDYSTPYTHVRRTLGVVADEQRVRVFDGTAEIACHARSYDRGVQIEDAAHIQALVERKRQAHAHRGADRLAHAAPSSATLLKRAAERGDNLGTITAALLRLEARYGAAALEAAIGQALAQGVPHPNAVRLALERAREAQGCRHPPRCT